VQLGMFTVFRRDPQHYLHAVALVASARRVLPGVPITHYTDDRSPIVPGVDGVRRLPDGPLLERRLEHYASAVGDWLFVDTDVELRADVSAVFDAPFDVALADRAWPGLPQGDEMLLTMPFNTGVVFSRAPAFWQDVLTVWRATESKDWLSEQRAVYQVVRSGNYRVQILPGQQYNYPPRTVDDPCEGAAIVHYKGPRKAWWTARYYQSLRPTSVAAHVCTSV